MHALLCSLFERSRAYAENDWNSHKLWDKWVEFESSRDVAHLAHVYLTATALPINQLARFQQSLTEFAGAHELAALVPADQVAAIVERVCSHSRYCKLAPMMLPLCPFFLHCEAPH